MTMDGKSNSDIVFTSHVLIGAKKRNHFLNYEN